ncbi:pathogen-associated molecular patterns-induced protein A70-like [Amaranthus tricolor]|uniref:pathogen-associated molecular patterns-induced protein A70-like n=1 Tax=Amaranthus tricolor TaxID=29722 RepID=UPI002585950A|nr:pathogen-associated molecular patterns-induced protein A70-like [Amaranthus tricolor]
MVEAQVIATWLTPTSLFVLLNIILATIFLATKNNSNNNNNNHDLNHQNDVVAAAPQLLRPPSLFTRVPSFNFSNNFYSGVQDPAVTVTRAPSLLYRVTSFNFGRAPQQPQVEGESKKENEKEEVEARDDHVRREKVVEEKDQPQQVEQVLEVSKKKKNNNHNNINNNNNNNNKVKSVKKISKEKTASSKGKDEEIEVDAKADDFINKFKQQLKLQRLESLLRYRNNNTPIAVAATT